MVMVALLDEPVAVIRARTRSDANSREVDRDQTSLVVYKGLVLTWADQSRHS